MKLVTVSQVLFGSDYPYRPGLEAVDGLADYKFSDADARAIDRDNAMKLLPNIKTG
jgi:predicted TIM-barrel fold metal-dependent hydrolase